MARVLAKLSGYEPLEINASDERTGSQILNKIKNAISSDDYFTSKTPLQKKLGLEQGTSKGKPVCLIIDEVDGALSTSFDGANSRGIAQIVEYLKKCIKCQSQTKTRTDFRGNENEEEEEDEQMESLNEGDGPTKTQQEKQSTKKMKKDTDVIPLRRPIIFICNDIYARPLAPLKEIALSIKIEEADRQKLLARMRDICQKEKV